MSKLKEGRADFAPPSSDLIVATQIDHDQIQDALRRMIDAILADDRETYMQHIALPLVMTNQVGVYHLTTEKACTAMVSAFSSSLRQRGVFAAQRDVTAMFPIGARLVTVHFTTNYFDSNGHRILTSRPASCTFHRKGRDSWRVVNIVDCSHWKADCASAQSPGSSQSLPMTGSQTPS